VTILTHTAEKAGLATRGYQPSRFLSIEELLLALGFAMVADGAFRRAIEDGVNSGHDTDSIGVMAGAILGAMHGESAVDVRDAERLNRANRLDLDAEATAFCETASAIIVADRRRAGMVEEQRSRLPGGIGSTLDEVRIGL